MFVKDKSLVQINTSPAIFYDWLQVTQSTCSSVQAAMLIAMCSVLFFSVWWLVADDAGQILHLNLINNDSPFSLVTTWRIVAISDMVHNFIWYVFLFYKFINRNKRKNKNTKQNKNSISVLNFKSSFCHSQKMLIFWFVVQKWSKDYDQHQE